MATIDDIRHLWREAFRDPAPYIDFYFSKVYDPADAMTLRAADVSGSAGELLSSLLLQPYNFAWQRGTVRAGYIAGAATARRHRGEGHMTSLLKQTLAAARDRDMALVTLIPANRHLYFFYDKLGFATTFYFKSERYSALHAFTADPSLTITELTDSDEHYEAFSRLEREATPAGVIHSRCQFGNLLADMAFDNSAAVAATDSKGEIVGMAFAAREHATDDPSIVVKEILGQTESVRDTLLEAVHTRFEPTPMIVRARPSDDIAGGALDAAGMVRIVNVTAMLAQLAEAHPKLRLTMRISDSLIAQNNGIYAIDKGTLSPGLATSRLDFDTDSTTLAKMLFSSAPIGDILGLPGCRPSMRLMLE